MGTVNWLLFNKWLWAVSKITLQLLEIVEKSHICNCPSSRTITIKKK